MLETCRVLTSAKYPGMSVVSKGWMADSAYFKGEGDQINIGLGDGQALNIFNDYLDSYDVLRW